MTGLVPTSLGDLIHLKLLVVADNMLTGQSFANAVFCRTTGSSGKKASRFCHLTFYCISMGRTLAFVAIPGSSRGRNSSTVVV